MSDRLPPIPTPPAQMWRQLRLQYLPIIVFILAVLAAAIIWTRWVAPPTLVAEAEAVRTEVRAADGGKLTDVSVEVLSSVKAGQTIGQVIMSDRRMLDSSLAVVRAEIEVLRASTNLALEQSRLEWMKRRVELVGMQGDLLQAQSALARSTELRRKNLVTEEEFEQAKNARDTIEARMKAESELIARLELGLKPATADEPSPVPTALQSLRATIQQKEAQLKLLEAQYAPLPLIAPIDGIVSLLYRRSGETVAAGEPVAQISAVGAERIIGFLRPPLTVVPKPGTPVEIRTRTLRRLVADATIAQVGSQLEPITPSLLAALRLPVTTIATEFGLRVLVSAPRGLKLRPGEQVDVIIRE
jgi:multidrug resistance efflux pump